MCHVHWVLVNIPKHPKDCLFQGLGAIAGGGGRESCPMNLRKQKARTPNGAKVAYKLMHFVMFHLKSDYRYAKFMVELIYLKGENRPLELLISYLAQQLMK